MKTKNTLKGTSKLDKWFLLTWRKTWIIVVTWFISVLLHNVVYGIFKNYFDSRGGDEAFFFIIATIIIPIYVIINLIYSLYRIIKRK